MRWQIIFSLVFITGIFLLSNVSAEQINAPTQQYNKIFLNPFYRASMTQNTNYTYNITINPPDKVSNVLSAIVSFDVYISPTVTFTLWVNGQACATPQYIISTTYSSAGQSRITFDCSNVINKAGTYNITLRPTQQNTGASTGWVDVTYVNNPQGSLTVHGTEYVFGQTAKVWLQLTDANDTAVTDGVCFVDIYNPDGSELVEHATMNNLNHDGIYYYDLAVPSVEGVYPSIARCYYVATQQFNYATAYILVNATLTSGTVTDTHTDNAVTLKTKEINVGGIRRIITDFTFDMSACRNVSEQLLTGISIYADAKFDSVANDDITVYIQNQTSGGYIALPNKILEGNVFRQVSNSLDFNNITTAGYVNSSSVLRLRFEDTNLTDGANDDLEMDYLYVSCDQLASPNWETLSGSSELHVSAPVNITFVADEIWNATNRSLTLYLDVTNYTKINLEVPQGVWNYTNRTLDANGISQIVNAIWSYSGTIASSILNQFSNSTWLWTPRNLTFYQNFTVPQVDMTNYTKITQDVSQGVWNYSTRNLTYYEHIDMTNYTRITESIWNATNRSLTLYIDMTDYQRIYNGVWNATDRNLTFYQNFGDQTNYSRISNLTASEVWDYNNRSLTLYFDTTDYQRIYDGVWNATDRNLTFYLDVTNYSLIASNTWSYPIRNLTYYPIVDVNTTQIAEAVWSFAVRNLTYYENFTVPQVDMTNYSLIGETVWVYPARNLTYYELSNLTESGIAQAVWVNPTRNLTYYENFGDQTNYSRISNLTASDVWVYPIRNLTYYENLDMTNYSLVAENVWLYSTRNLTYYLVNNLTAGDIWTFTPDRNLTYYPPMNVTTEVVNITVQNVTINNSEVANAVWTHTPDRNLTYYENFTVPQVDMTNYTLIQEMVWNATVRTLTDFNFTVVVNDTAIADSVWAYYNRTLTDYNQTDLTNYTLIQELVWNATVRTLTDFNFTVDVNQTALADAVWTYYNRTLTDYNQSDLTNYTLIQELVWNATVRTLTDFNFTVELNQTQLADSVWNYYNRTLTDYNQSDLTNYTLIQNLIDNAKNNLTAQDIWEYTPDRNLTYYPPMQITVNATVNVSADDIATAVWNYNGTINDNVLNQFSNKVSCIITKLLSNTQSDWVVEIKTC